jgi:hypothetical protein
MAQVKARHRKDTIDGLIGLCRDHLDVEIYDGTLSAESRNREWRLRPR